MGVRSSYGTTGMAPVLAAGVGVRHGWTWVLRAASFRLDPQVAGRPVIGIAVARETARSAVADLLGGLARPAYGELRVLGQDLTTPQGRRRGAPLRGHRPLPGAAAAGAPGAQPDRPGGPDGQPAGTDGEVLAAAILDRLALTPWADVPVPGRAPVIARRVRLGRRGRHEPDLLLIDPGLLDCWSRPARTPTTSWRLSPTWAGHGDRGDGCDSGGAREWPAASADPRGRDHRPEFTRPGRSLRAGGRGPGMRAGLP